MEKSGIIEFIDSKCGQRAQTKSSLALEPLISWPGNSISARNIMKEWPQAHRGSVSCGRGPRSEEWLPSPHSQANPVNKEVDREVQKLLHSVSARTNREMKSGMPRLAKNLSTLPVTDSRVTDYTCSQSGHMDK